MGDDCDDDGQLHTLGLLERLRSETNLVRGAYDGLYERVDKLLRELENPNLHDIANMSFRVELWDQHACISGGLSPLQALSSWRVPRSTKHEAVAKPELHAATGDHDHARTSLEQVIRLK